MGKEQLEELLVSLLVALDFAYKEAGYSDEARQTKEKSVYKWYFLVS